MYMSFLNYHHHHSKKIVSKALDRSMRSISDLVTISTLTKYHCKNPSLLSSFVLGIVEEFESSTGESYSELSNLSMSRIDCNYDVTQVDIVARRAGRVYAECILDNTNMNYSQPTKYIANYIKKGTV